MQAADVDDIVQEAAIRAFRQLDRFMSQEHLVRWCCRVAINAHIDAVRKNRRLVAEPSEDAAGPLNVAEAVEGRLALDAALAQVAGLSPEDRELLLNPPSADTRKEAVRLAVRRHRLRARLTNVLEGVLAGVPVLRRLRADSWPVRAAMVAAPVVAALTALPFVVGAGPTGASNVQRSEQTVIRSWWIPPRTGVSPARRVEQESVVDAAPPAHARTLSRTYVDLHPAGTNVGVRQDDEPPGTPFLCLIGYVNRCVDRPGPHIPLPPPPIRGDRVPAS